MSSVGTRAFIHCKKAYEVFYSELYTKLEGTAGKSPRRYGLSLLNGYKFEDLGVVL